MTVKTYSVNVEVTMRIKKLIEVDTDLFESDHEFLPLDQEAEALAIFEIRHELRDPLKREFVRINAYNTEEIVTDG